MSRRCVQNERREGEVVSAKKYTPDPVRARRSVKTLKIDGMDVTGREDQTILEVAKENDIYIPTLCHLDGLTSIGACRMCMVELQGPGKLVPSCTTLIDEGMDVRTDTERIVDYRRKVVELLFSERNHICAVCVSNGDCELQDLAQELGVNHIRYPYLNPEQPVDATDGEFGADHNRCVLCRRCVRVCGEVEGAHTWDVMGRGVDSCVITDLKEDWGKSETCTHCGKCVQVCPVGALFEKGKGVAEMRKDRDFVPYLQTMREMEQE